MNLELVGASSALCDIDQEIDFIARSDVKVLITGESGVGKDLVGRLIHERRRRRGPFVTINCAGVPDSLLESELFGDVRGSFTGAYRDIHGSLERAHGGTICLDEVGEMSPRMQALLLRFLETGEIQRVGGEQVQIVRNVRVITATNRNLAECLADRRFREDLYCRINVIHITIPPLRERPNDIVPLVAHFLAIFSAKHRVVRPVLSEEALANLTAYDWPGNVRELRNTVERLVVRHGAGLISPVDLPSAISGAVPARRPTIDVMYERMVEAGESFWTVVHGPFLSHDVTRDELRGLVAQGLKQTRGSYKGLMALFNLTAGDDKRFLAFLRKHECRLPFLDFRLVPGSSTPVSQSPSSSPLLARHG
jgi:transcriptional regulator with PAS, ATPase and Fis domain